MKIYLAAPYTHRYPEIVENRVKLINKVAALLMQRNCIVYSPISHCHAIAKENNLPTDAEYWERQNKSFIQWCDQLVILQLHGWAESKGIAQEILMAKEYKKQVTHIDEAGMLV